MRIVREIFLTSSEGGKLGRIRDQLTRAVTAVVIVVPLVNAVAAAVVDRIPHKLLRHRAVVACNDR